MERSLPRNPIVLLQSDDPHPSPQTSVVHTSLKFPLVTRRFVHFNGLQVGSSVETPNLKQYIVSSFIILISAHSNKYIDSERWKDEERRILTERGMSSGQLLIYSLVFCDYLLAAEGWALFRDYKGQLFE